MPAYKYFANRLLTTAENIVLGQNVGDFHTGYRAYTRRVLETLPFTHNSDNFVFDTEFLVQSVYFGFRIGCVPVPVRYFSEASSIDFSNSAVYGLQTLRALGKFMVQKTGLKHYRLFAQDEVSCRSCCGRHHTRSPLSALSKSAFAGLACRSRRCSITCRTPLHSTRRCCPLV